MIDWLRYFFLWNESDLESAIRKDGHNLNKREQRAVVSNEERLKRKLILRRAYRVKKDETL